MARGTTNWLQIKVIAGLGALLTGAALIVGYLGVLAEENNASQELLSRVRQLEVQGQAIQRRGITYAANVPRDFAPYERDMIIFYPDFMRDLGAFDQQIRTVARAADGLPSGRLYTANIALTSSVGKMRKDWETFRLGLLEKLGPTPTEPRLEWGAEYVRDNQVLINSLTGELIRTVEQAIQERLNRNAELTVTAIAGAGGLLLLGVIWFYLSVVRRISATVKGCQRVAQGDFGYQIPERGNDELTSLARAFNSLSARTRFVLTMLSKMHRSGSAESKIESLWTEANAYLPMQWLGLWQADARSGNMKLLSLRSDKPIADVVFKSLENMAHSDEHLFRMSQAAQPIKVDKLTEYVLKTPNARLLREMAKLEKLNSLLLVPLATEDGWHGLLMFIAAQPAAYSDDQVELLGNLAPYMANGFAHAETDLATPADLPRLAAA